MAEDVRITLNQWRIEDIDPKNRCEKDQPMLQIDAERQAPHEENKLLQTATEKAGLAMRT